MDQEFEVSTKPGFDWIWVITFIFLTFLAILITMLFIKRGSFESIVGFLFFALILAVVFIVLSVLVMPFVALLKKKKYAIAIGGIIGIVLAVVNFFVLGYIGFPFGVLLGGLIMSSCETLENLLSINFCPSGEGSIVFFVIGGSVGLILFGFLIGWIIEKIKSRQNTASPKPANLQFIPLFFV